VSDIPERPADLVAEAGEFLYRGKAKEVYAGPDADTVVIHFSDRATAGNGAKAGTIADKGSVNAQVSAAVFGRLERAGVRTHLVRALSGRDLLCRRVTIVPIEVVVRNRTTGSIVRRIGAKEGMALDPPLVEWYLKDDNLGDPILTDDHVRLLGIGDDALLAELKRRALTVNRELRAFFGDRGLELIDFKLEFGRTAAGELLLADEISPDTCRLWDLATGQKMDKDRFRLDLGGEAEAYAEVLRRTAADR
jgi:phosphoribosylaminoimidazole-succinocarboxamide synthase